MCPSINGRPTETWTKIPIRKPPTIAPKDVPIPPRTVPAKISKSIFYISTHITEIAEKLNNLNNIDFKYFDSKIIDKTPVYNYELKDGISSERLGMYIVENENIISILDSIKEK